MQHVATLPHAPTCVVNSVARHLGDPGFCGVSSDPGEGNASSLQVQEEQDIVGDETAPGQDFDREEIGAGKN